MIEDCHFLIDGYLQKSSDKEGNKFKIASFESKLSDKQKLHEMDESVIYLSE